MLCVRNGGNVRFFDLVTLVSIEVGTEFYFISNSYLASYLFANTIIMSIVKNLKIRRSKNLETDYPGTVRNPCIHLGIFTSRSFRNRCLEN